MKSSLKSLPRSSICAGWVIGTYLVIHTISLSIVAVIVWVCPTWNCLWLIPSLPITCLPAAKFIPFQRAVISACAAGLGAGVFMIREFYLNFAYGGEEAGQPFHFLRSREIPRYILLPLSAVVLGPIGLGLMEAGKVVLSANSLGTTPPLLSVVIICFLLGFSYHDTLTALRKYSRKLLSSEKAEEAGKGQSSKKSRPASDTDQPASGEEGERAQPPRQPDA